MRKIWTILVAMIGASSDASAAYSGCYDEAMAVSTDSNFEMNVEQCAEEDFDELDRIMDLYPHASIDEKVGMSFKAHRIADRLERQGFDVADSMSQSSRTCDYCVKP